MKDASGASQMDPKTQVTSLHGVSMLDAAQYPLETQHRPGAGARGRAAKTTGRWSTSAVGAVRQPARHARRSRRRRPRATPAMRPTRCWPPRLPSSGPKRVEPAAQAAAAADRALRARPGCRSALGRGLRLRRRSMTDEARAACSSANSRTPRPRPCWRACGRGAPIGLRALPREPRRSSDRGRRAGRDHGDARLGTADAQAHLPAHGRKPALVDAAVRHADRRFGRRPSGTSPIASAASRTRRCWCTARLTEVAFLALLGQDAEPSDLFAFQTLVGLLLTQRSRRDLGPGRQGRGSADGPETPERVQLNKALVGFLTHSRLRARRQRLRGHRLPARPVQGQRPGDPGDPTTAST